MCALDLMLNYGYACKIKLNVLIYTTWICSFVLDLERILSLTNLDIDASIYVMEILQRYSCE